MSFTKKIFIFIFIGFIYETYAAARQVTEIQQRLACQLKGLDLPDLCAANKDQSENSESDVDNVDDVGETNDDELYREFTRVMTTMYAYRYESADLILKTEYGSELYLGNADFAEDNERCNKLGITHILSLDTLSNARIKELRANDIKHRFAPMNDSGKSSLDGILNDPDKDGKSTNDFINEGLNSENKILLHCKLGQNRSASILIAYLVSSLHLPAEPNDEELGLDKTMEDVCDKSPSPVGALLRSACMRTRTLKEAFNLVKGKRAIVTPHPEYEKQLRALDKALHPYLAEDDRLPPQQTLQEIMQDLLLEAELERQATTELTGTYVW